MCNWNVCATSLLGIYRRFNSLLWIKFNLRELRLDLTCQR